MTRRNIASGAAWEPLFGYSRAVRAGDYVHVSGTTAFGPDGAIVGRGDVAAQAEQALANVRDALEAAGASLADVVRTRVYVTDIDQWRAVADAHRRCFGDVRPAATLVEVSRLVDPALLVEVEADAYAPEGASGP